MTDLPKHDFAGCREVPSTTAAHTAPAPVAVEAGLVERLNKRASQIGQVLSDPPHDRPDAALMHEAASAITSLQEQVEALTQTVQCWSAATDEDWATAFERMRAQGMAAEAEVTRLRQRVEEMDAALGPFARHADCFDRLDEYDHYSISAVSTLPDGKRSAIIIGDLRAARLARARTKEPNNV